VFKILGEGQFSTKLRKLTEEKGKPVDFLNIDNIKMKIKKEAQAKKPRSATFSNDSNNLAKSVPKVKQ